MANREYKDRLFRLVFQKKEDLLSLYNAVNGTSYEDPDDLEVNTLENVLYLSMKNDVSFLIGADLNLYEHQSTYNPNMPMRGLLYFSKLYETHIDRLEINIYSSAAKTFPFPQHIVFYNGTKEEPDRQILRLSDLFSPSQTGKEPCLECTTLMLNINYGHNQALMEKCRRLEEYAIFVETVCSYHREDLPLETAIGLAIDDCIHRGVLKDILIQQRAEVVQMVLETFDQEKYEKAMKQEGYEDGYQAGEAHGYQAGEAHGYQAGEAHGLQEGLRRLICTLQELQLTKEEILAKIQEAYSLTEKEAADHLEKYGKQ